MDSRDALRRMRDARQREKKMKNRDGHHTFQISPVVLLVVLVDNDVTIIRSWSLSLWNPSSIFPC